MTRPIKFRAWDVARKVMVEWEDLETLNTMAWCYENEHWKLMQSTGLLDKNGKEIYEGDVVRNDWFDINGKDLGRLWQIKFGKHMTSADHYACSAYGWYAEAIDDKDPIEKEHSLHNLPCNNGFDVEIIANIYEKPRVAK